MVDSQLYSVSASVIICTRNRANSLKRVLTSLTQLKSDGIAWELLVVDNGSSDQTLQVVNEFAARLPIRAISEPEPGLSNARNAALQQAQGQYLIFTDDDVELDEMWLSAYIKGFTDYPHAAIFGGKAIPVFEAPKAEWMERSADCLTDLLAIRDFGPLPLRLNDKIVPYGLNYAIRAQEHKLEIYDPNLGVAPGRRTGGEETSVIRNLIKRGYEGVWLPSPVVYHLIPRERQTVSYVRSYYVALGAYMADVFLPDGSRTLHGYPVWRARKWLVESLKYRLLRLIRRKGWVEALVESSINFGFLSRVGK